jgi:O-antigen ligase
MVERYPLFGRWFTQICVLLIAWGALSFGAVFPWGYLPLLAGCAALGFLALVFSPRREVLNIIRPLTMGLVALIVAVVLQLVPLSRSMLARVSPATHAVLSQYDLEYSVSNSMHPFSIQPDDTRLGLVFLFALGFLLVGTTRALSCRSWRGMVRGLVVLGALLALIAIIQKAAGTYKVYGLWSLPTVRSPFGPFGNKNHFAGWMLMVLPTGLGYFLGLVEERIQNAKRGWRNRILWFGSSEASEILLVGFAIGLMGLSLVLTLSRSGIGAFLLALLITGWVITRKQAVRAQRIVGVSCLGSLAIVSIEWTGSNSVIARFAALRGSGLAGRLGIWRDTVRIVEAFPITGTGLGTYGHAMLFYQKLDLPNLYVWAHNDYLQLVADGGLLLGIPIAALIGLFVREVRRRFRERADDRLSYCIRLGAVTGLLAVALQDTVDFSLQIPGNAALFVVLCAVAAASGQNRNNRPRVFG